MRKRVNTERKDVPEWFQMAENEKLLFCGYSPATLRNPVASNAMYSECVVLTDKRLVTFCPLGLRGGTPAVTTVPLSRVSAVQTTCIDWNTATILICVVLFLLYILPGVIFLVFMWLYRGPRVNVVAGILRTEIKFHPNSQQLLQRFLAYLDVCTSYR